MRQGLQSLKNGHPNTTKIVILRDCKETQDFRCDRQESLKYFDIQTERKLFQSQNPKPSGAVTRCGSYGRPLGPSSTAINKQVIVQKYPRKSDAHYSRARTQIHGIKDPWTAGRNLQGQQCEFGTGKSKWGRARGGWNVFMGKGGGPVWYIKWSFC